MWNNKDKNFRNNKELMKIKMIKNIFDATIFLLITIFFKEQIVLVAAILCRSLVNFISKGQTKQWEIKHIKR